MLLLSLILSFLFIHDLICFHTQEAQRSEQPAMEPQHDQRRRERVNRDLKALLATCSDECVCQIEHCSLRSSDVRFRDLQGESSCGPDGSRCALCKTFCQHATALCGLLDTSGATRTALTSQRLQRCPAVHAIYCAALPNTLPPEQRVRRKQRVKAALCSLLDCQRNRLSCFNQVGQLSALVPRILRLQLLSGHSLFWEQMRKLGSAVSKQMSREAQRAVLAAVRQRLPEDSPWRPYLTTDREASSS